MRLAFLAPALAASLLAACGGDASHDSATFASATDEQLLRAIDVARFEDVGEVLEFAEMFGLAQTGCPTVTTVGLATTVTTDCTTSSGWALTGRIVITNFGFETTPAYDPSQPTTIEAVDLRGTRGGQVQSIDGSLELVLGSDSPEGPIDFVASLDMAVGALAAHTEGAVRCGAEGDCVYDGAWLGVDTLGEAAVDDGPFSDGSDVPVTLRGADTLVITAGRDDQGCFATTIDGAARQVCEGVQRRTATPWSTILR